MSRGRPPRDVATARLRGQQSEQACPHRKPGRRQQHDRRKSVDHKRPRVRNGESLDPLVPGDQRQVDPRMLVVAENPPKGRVGLPRPNPAVVVLQGCEHPIERDARGDDEILQRDGGDASGGDDGRRGNRARRAREPRSDATALDDAEHRLPAARTGVLRIGADGNAQPRAVTELELREQAGDADDLCQRSARDDFPAVRDAPVGPRREPGANSPTRATAAAQPSRSRRARASPRDAPTSRPRARAPRPGREQSRAGRLARARRRGPPRGRTAPARRGRPRYGVRGAAASTIGVGVADRQLPGGHEYTTRSRTAGPPAASAAATTATDPRIRNAATRARLRVPVTVVNPFHAVARARRTGRPLSRTPRFGRHARRAPQRTLVQAPARAPAHASRRCTPRPGVRSRACTTCCSPRSEDTNRERPTPCGIGCDRRRSRRRVGLCRRARARRSHRHISREH